MAVAAASAWARRPAVLQRFAGVRTASRASSRLLGSAIRRAWSSPRRDDHTPVRISCPRRSAEMLAVRLAMLAAISAYRISMPSVAAGWWRVSSWSVAVALSLRARVRSSQVADDAVSVVVGSEPVLTAWLPPGGCSIARSACRSAVRPAWQDDGPGAGAGSRRRYSRRWGLPRAPAARSSRPPKQVR